MYVNTERNSGLFNYLGGSMIVNLRIEKSVVLGKNAGALAGASENSYIDGVEVRNVHIYGSDVSGGLVGQFTRVTHVVQLLFYTTFLAFAALPNPLYFRDTRDMNYSSYVNNCKVIDSKVSVDGFTWDPRAGGIVGGTWRGAIYNSLSINDTVSSSRHVTIYTAACGAVIGEVDYQGKCVIENCYSYGFKRGDGVEAISDKDRVNYISKKTATSSSLVKKLGKGFVAVKNSYES